MESFLLSLGLRSQVFLGGSIYYFCLLFPTSILRFLTDFWAQESILLNGLRDPLTAQAASLLNVSHVRS